MRGPLPTPDQRTAECGMIDNAAASLRSTEMLLGGLLDISSLDAGNVRVQKRSFAIDELLGGLRVEFSALAQERGLTLKVVSCGAVVRSDPQLLRRVLQYFLSIALRYSAKGGVLLVCNHVSYIDWLLVWAACPRRVTFVLWEGYYKNPIQRFFLSWVPEAIKIDNRSSRPHSLMDSLKKIAAALDAGQCVLVFAEGRLTRSGHMLPFGRGLELLLKRTTTDVTVSAPAGIYEFYCNLPGHKAAGMVGTLTVR